MGKASRWIRNFLLGKKDEKEYKKINRLLTAESIGTPKVTLSSIAKEKRRWSFKRLGNADAIAVTHKRTGSFDSSFTNTQLVKQALLECDIEQIRGIVIGKPSSNGVIKTAAPGSSPVTRDLEDAAAIKIQAMFRSYLSRRALRALRGLVKIQALVRGHLVRKQTTQTIKCMHALMAIQLRARVQRVQMTEETQTVGKKRLTHRESSENCQFITACNDKVNLKIDESEGASESKSGDMNQPQAERTEDKFSFSMHHSGRHSISSPSTLLTNYDRQIAEFSFNMPHRNSQHHSKVFKTKQTKGPFTLPYTEISSSSGSAHSGSFVHRTGSFVHQTAPYTEKSNSTFWGCHFTPTYMSKTESSRAKARSRSEPKQRPKWGIKQKSRRSTSIESMNVNHIGQENQHPWFIKLHQAARSSIDSKCNSTGMSLTNSSCRNLTACQTANSSFKTRIGRSMAVK